MKKIIIIVLSIAFLWSNSASAKEECFLLYENNQIIKQTGDCQIRYAPCSTFKIFLSLIGYDSGILEDETHPVWKFEEGYADWRDVWKQDYTPTSWMKESCVWYSQVLTKRLGMKKFQDYVNKLNYGNMDVSGDVGKNNGLTNAWLSSSLEISPMEQLDLLQKLISSQLPLSIKSQEMTKKILYIEELPHGWKLYGKTGSGSLLNQDRTIKTDIQHGWFIGWIQKDERIILFVNHIIDDKALDTYAGPRARAEVKEKLLELINRI